MWIGWLESCIKLMRHGTKMSLFIAIADQELEVVPQCSF